MTLLRSHRLPQFLLIGTFLPLCWLGMMAVHEAGHVLGAVASGGGVERVVLHPLAISRTDVSPNPHPLFVVWCGPWAGVLIPLAGMAWFRWASYSWSYLVQFFAGFCLITNGCYLGAGSFTAAGDAGDMLHLGCPIWTLWLFGAGAVPLGLFLWNGLGPHFGLGAAAGKVDRRAAWFCCGLFVAAVVLGAALSPR